jgi:hypothetical protein
MQSIRAQVLHHFSLDTGSQAPDDALANALYALLRSVHGTDVTVDGWAHLRIVSESKESLRAVGLMTLLPSRSAPVEVHCEVSSHGFAWSARIGRIDPPWVALSDSQRWNNVYLYALGEGAAPQWEWGEQHHGSINRSDA